MSTDATAVVGTPTLPAKGVIKARVRGRLGALVALYNEAQMTAGSQSEKAKWMKAAMNKRVHNKKIADVAAAHGAHDAATLEEKLKAQARYETSMRMHKRHRVDYEREVALYKDLTDKARKSEQNSRAWTNKVRTEYDEYVKQKWASLAQMKEMSKEIEETKAAMWASVEPRVQARVKEEREEIEKEREDGLKFIETRKLYYEVTQKEKNKIWADEQQLYKDRRQFEQEKRKLDLPKLLAKISVLERQLQTKKKRQRSHREQEERRAIMREEDKKSKENTPPTQTKRQKGSE